MAQNERKDDLEPGQIRYTDGNGDYATGYVKDGYVYTDPNYTTPIPTGSVVHTDNGYYRKGNYGSYAMGTAADYKDQMQGYLQQINNRKPFQFDLNGDALYQQYRDQYTQLGRQAMEDTMGQAAGLTGGYGSTYGQAVGQQQYQAYLDRLNDVIPDIYAKQRSDYDAETNELYNRWNAANAAYGTAYQEELNRDNMAYERAWNEDARAYEREQAARKMAQDELNSIISAGGNPPADLIAASGYSQDYINAMKTYYAQKTAASGGSGYRGSNNPGSRNKYTQDELMSNYSGFLSGNMSQAQLEDYVASYAEAVGMSEAAVWQMLAGGPTGGGGYNSGTGGPGGGNLINRDMPQ